MKSLFVILVGFVLVVSSPAAIRYVNVNNANPMPPYTNWSTAANVIQDAVDVALSGDEIVVTNGIYATGGRVAGTYALVNRVAVEMPITLRSVNGAEFTVIQGRQVPGTINGDSAARCVYLADGATLSGFTLTNGATRLYPYSNQFDQYGGGLLCGSALVTNCIVTGNSSDFYGGGVYGGTLKQCVLSNNSAFAGGGAAWARLNNCTITGNSAPNGGGVNGGVLENCALYGNTASEGEGAHEGGGASNATLTNCTVTGNTAGVGGGTWYCRVNNCIVYHNSASNGANNYGSTLNYCCTTPDVGGVGNITLDPQLATATYLSPISPCLGAGNAAYATGVDIDGEPWKDPPAIGCDEYHFGAVTGALTVRIVARHTNVGPGFAVGLTALIDGKPSFSMWDFNDGTVVTNRPYVTHAWTTPNVYVVVLRAYNPSNPWGVSTAVTIRVGEAQYYVAAGNTNPVPPYASWGTAATNIQDAVDVAEPGSLVLVSNGVYATGGRAMHGTMTNRVAVDKPITVRSVNGPQFTIIQGYQVPGPTNGDGAIRCVYLTNGASLIGFTVTEGATRFVAESWPYRQSSGGGVWCDLGGASISNCIVIGNAANGPGGGAFLGTLYNCRLEGNIAYGQAFELGGGGGGAYGSTLINCTLAGNRAGLGGGMYYGQAINSIVTYNIAFNHGGGGFACSFRNSTVVGNSAVTGGGGASESGLLNSIVYYNSATSGEQNAVACIGDNSCTTDYLPPYYGVRNITNAPLFVNVVGGNLRLKANSPCINSGRNADTVGLRDFDGNARIRGGTVDMGAFEYQTPTSTLSYAWAQKYGLPTNGSADFSDPDGDQMNNWQEWRADTIPTSFMSALRMLSPAAGTRGVTVSWESVNTRSYWLERAGELTTTPSFSIIASNLPNQIGSTAFTDTNAIGSGPFFYRVGVQP